MFVSVLENVASNLSISTALFCTATSLALGLLIATTYMKCGSYNKNFAVSLVLLPSLVQIVIMMVNGNLGTGVAVMGAFSLVRFRSLPGSSKDITSIFFAMSVGLATGMGYISFAVVLSIVICLSFLLLSRSAFGDSSNYRRFIRISIPENLNYVSVFDDLFKKYTKEVTLEKIKTTNLGSMFNLYYNVVLISKDVEKELIDKIRERNGNLSVTCSMQALYEEL